MYMTICTGAFGEPSFRPVCGMPLYIASASVTPGRPAAAEPFVCVIVGVDEPPPVRTTINTTTTAITAAAAPAPIKTRGDACRPRGMPCERTGGGAAAAARFRSLLFLPLAIGGQGTGVVVGTGGRER